jgi:transposase-like protein
MTRHNRRDSLSAVFPVDIRFVGHPSRPATSASKVIVAADERQPIAPAQMIAAHRSVRAFQKNLNGMRDRSPALVLSAHDHDLLLKWSKSRTLPARVVTRSRIVVMLARNATLKTIARELRIAPGTIRLWRRRFRERGPQGLLDEARGRGRKPTLSHAERQALRTETARADALTVRERARQLGVSASTVSRWRRRRD